MLSTEDNELLCRVGPGTRMGAFLREYWLPAFVPSELPAPDSDPMRLRLLGENLIAFRVTSGKFGLVANNCPHRGASLFFGRNEEEGLRCVYHGWKFSVDGACVDMPNEPAESDFRTKIKAVAYPCEERNGIVWTYMGPREIPPPLPDWLPNLEPDCQVWMRLQESNWLQALEGDIDTVHAFFLHAGHYQTSQSLPGSDAYYITQQRHGRFVAQDHDVGASYAAVRTAEPGTEYWRMGHFLMPFYTMNAPGLLGVKNQSLAWVPLDDHNTMVWTVGRQAPLAPETETIGGFKAGYVRRDPIGKNDPYGARSGNGVPVRKFDSSSDWLGRFRPIANLRRRDRAPGRQRPGCDGRPAVRPRPPHRLPFEVGDDRRSVGRSGSENARWRDGYRWRIELLLQRRKLSDQGAVSPKTCACFSYAAAPGTLNDSMGARPRRFTPSKAAVL